MMSDDLRRGGNIKWFVGAVLVPIIAAFVAAGIFQIKDGCIPLFCGNGHNQSTSIGAVVFTGTATHPTITVNGGNFGSEPAGAAWNSTPCGSYTDNGKNYGPQVRFLDVGHFAAGGGGCIGIKVLSWSVTRVVFQFGNSYNTFDHWYVTADDSYDLTLVGQQFTGTITFS